MVNKNPIDGRATLLMQVIKYSCVCEQILVVLVSDTSSEIIECGNCQTEWVVYANAKIRKTSKQINKELGYDVEEY